MVVSRKHRANLLIWVIVFVAACWAFFPFYWAIITSFKPPGVILTKPSLVPWLQYTPTTANWENEYVTRGKEIGSSLRNSVIIAGGATIIAISLGTMAGYGLARFRFHRWKNKDMTLWFLSQRFLPPMATAIPFFLVMKYFKLLDTHWALIMANATFVLPFAVLILRDVFKELPVELEEAALVDGASRFGTFLRIGLPLAAPAIAVAAVICFAFAWNEFLFGLILTYQKAQPVTVIIAGVEHTQGIQFWFIATRLLAAIIPPAILALLAQRYVVRALTFGAIKG
ncbi:MAG TPA: carbohydrate ABC transporter permease [Spirochaetia bacterium]|nr:carbohydrate ABC transporter permease [Spirochaetia bacterium]